jgi:dTDP-4-amino-4,6-dideoxygalactose transaminase
VIRTEQRDMLRERLVGRGISASIHYPIPIHLQPAYRDLGYKQGDFPVTEAYAQQIVSLPMYAELTPELIENVAQAVRDFTPASPAGRQLYEQFSEQADSNK